LSKCHKITDYISRYEGINFRSKKKKRVIKISNTGLNVLTVTDFLLNHLLYRNYQ